jgi:hypothetical protein
MKIKTGLLYYIACIIICLIVCFVSNIINNYINSQYIIIAFIAPYIFSGVFLRKKVHENLVKYHFMSNTLDNVAFDKIKIILFWFYYYPFFFAKLTINKYL